MDMILLNPLFIFEPMKGLEHWGDLRMFVSTGNRTCKFILNMFKGLNLSDGQTVIKGVAVTEACMNEGSGYCGSGGGIESVSDGAKIGNLIMTGAEEG